MPRGPKAPSVFVMSPSAGELKLADARPHLLHSLSAYCTLQDSSRATVNAAVAHLLQATVNLRKPERTFTEEVVNIVRDHEWKWAAARQAGLALHDRSLCSLVDSMQRAVREFAGKAAKDTKE